MAGAKSFRSVLFIVVIIIFIMIIIISIIVVIFILYLLIYLFIHLLVYWFIYLFIYLFIIVAHYSPPVLAEMAIHKSVYPHFGVNGSITTPPWALRPSSSKRNPPPPPHPHHLRTNQPDPGIHKRHFQPNLRLSAHQGSTTNVPRMIKNNGPYTRPQARSLS